MTPEASEDDVRGVAVWRFLVATGAVTYRTYKPSATESTPGSWHSLAPEAQALLDVEKFCRVGNLNAMSRALDRLSEARR